MSPLEALIEERAETILHQFFAAKFWRHVSSCGEPQIPQEMLHLGCDQDLLRAAHHGAVKTLVEREHRHLLDADFFLRFARRAARRQIEEEARQEALREPGRKVIVRRAGA